MRVYRKDVRDWLGHWKHQILIYSFHWTTSWLPGGIKLASNRSNSTHVVNYHRAGWCKVKEFEHISEGNHSQCVKFSMLLCLHYQSMWATRVPMPWLVKNEPVKDLYQNFHNTQRTNKLHTWNTQ